MLENQHILLPVTSGMGIGLCTCQAEESSNYCTPITSKLLVVFSGWVYQLALRKPESSYYYHNQDAKHEEKKRSIQNAGQCKNNPSLGNLSQYFNQMAFLSYIINGTYNHNPLCMPGGFMNFPIIAWL